MSGSNSNRSNEAGLPEPQLEDAHREGMEIEELIPLAAGLPGITDSLLTVNVTVNEQSMYMEPTNTQDVNLLADRNPIRISEHSLAGIAMHIQGPGRHGINHDLHSTSVGGEGNMLRNILTFRMNLNEIGINLSESNSANGTAISNESQSTTSNDNPQEQ